ATAEIARTSGEPLGDTRRKRAEALRELGFWRLAVLDEAHAVAPHEGIEADIDRDNVVVYGAAARVVPLGWTPWLPPLALPDEPALLRQAVAARRAQAPGKQVLELLAS